MRGMFLVCSQFCSQFVPGLCAQEVPTIGPVPSVPGFNALSQARSESIHITFYLRGTVGTVGTRRGVNHLPAKIGWEQTWNTWNTEHAGREATV